MYKKTDRTIVLISVAVLALILTFVLLKSRKDKPAVINTEQTIENRQIADPQEVAYVDSLKEQFIRQIYVQELGIEDSDIIEAKYELWKKKNKEYLDQIKVEVIEDDE